MSLATRPTWRSETGMLTASLGDFDLLVAFPAEGVARVCLYPGGERPRSSPAIVDPEAPGLPFRVKEAAYGLFIEGPGLVLGLRLIHPHTADSAEDEAPGGDGGGTGEGGVSRSGEGGEARKALEARVPPLMAVEVSTRVGEPALASDLEFYSQAQGWEITLPLHRADRCFGLGEKTGYLDRRGRTYTMWNTDDASPHIETLDPMYVSIPFLIHMTESGGACGLYLDDSHKTEWDVGYTDPSHVRVKTPRDSADLYFVAGPRITDVVRRYAAVTGTMPLPPKWALGFQQCRYSYMSADRVREVAGEFRKREIPCDVLYLDIDYMDEYRVFTWDPEQFPDPAGLVHDLRTEGFRAITIVDPGVKKEAGYEVFDDGLARGSYVLDADGVPYVGEVWPGKVVYPDFSRPDVRKWWGERHRPLFDAGIAGIWNDMNEPSDFSPGPKGTLPEDAIHGGRRRHAEMHNLYGMHMSQATREALQAERPGERPFVLSRAGFAGIQRFAAIWTGDNHSIWLHLEQSLPMAMNLGLSGVAFVGPDCGGFSGDGQGELLARWTQVGALTPFFRNHSSKGTRDQEPWTFGPEIEEICRRYIRLRYELLPYLYTQFRKAATDGTPILRPLVYDFAADPEVRPIADQAMVGPSLMMCPIVRPHTTRRVAYLPAGEWYDAWTAARLKGGDWHILKADLATLPLLVRAGAVLPRSAWGPSTDGQPRGTLSLEVFPGPQLSGEWYDDDGISHAYLEGVYSNWKFGGDAAGSTLKLSLEQVHGGYPSPERQVRVVLRGVARVGAASGPEGEVAWRTEGGDVVAEGPLASGDWEFTGVEYRA